MQKKVKIKDDKNKRISKITKDFTNKVRKNPKRTALVLAISGLLLIASTYAWFSASLNVKVKFFDVVVSSDNGLFISLDGVNYSDSVEISLDSVINDLRTLYPTHTNQWSVGGLWPVSSNGIRNQNSDRFDIFIGEVSKKRRNEPGIRYLNTYLATEYVANAYNVYIAFDIFLKNVSGSPKSDNLFFDSDTTIEFDQGVDQELSDSMSNILNSMRFGVVKMGSTTSKAPINEIQNLKCNNACQSVIFEPNHISHSEKSVNSALEHGVTLIDGIAVPTYGVIAEGNRLRHVNGQTGTGVPLDTEHFRLQETITSFDKPIFQIPNGITKLRAYVWIEGQDMDSLETYSEGAPIYIYVNFEKDLAGYE